MHWNGLLSFFIACMKFWTKRSANQQVLGWYCVLDFIQFDESFEFFRYKLRTIIRQICFGSPNLAKMYLNAFTVLEAVVEFISGQLLWLPTPIRNTCFWNGPAKLISSLSHGALLISQEWTGAARGLKIWLWHSGHEWHICSISISFVHQT